MGPHRASISGNPLTAPGLPTWDQELVEPFVDYQADYGTLEKRYLSDALRTILTEDARPNADKARLLREWSVDVFGVADEAITRCQAFTHGYGAAGLVRALESFFKSFVDQSKAEVASSKTGASGGFDCFCVGRPRGPGLHVGRLGDYTDVVAYVGGGEGVK